MALRLPRPRVTRPRENTIALINVVFLTLIFFLIAGTLTPPLDKDVSLISMEQALPADPPEALFVTAAGELRWQGKATTVPEFLADREATDGEPVKIAADRALLAETLIDIVGELRSAGAEKIVVVTDRASR